MQFSVPQAPILLRQGIKKFLPVFSKLLLPFRQTGVRVFVIRFVAQFISPRSD